MCKCSKYRRCFQRIMTDFMFEIFSSSYEISYLVQVQESMQSRYITGVQRCRPCLYTTQPPCHSFCSEVEGAASIP
jgi:hypothetical protein